MTDENTFTTTQTPLAAWLHCQGFRLINVNTTDYPATMSFEDSESLQKAKRQWELKQAVGDCNAFYDSHRMLLGMIRPSWLWRGNKPQG